MKVRTRLFIRESESNAKESFEESQIGAAITDYYLRKKNNSNYIKFEFEEYLSTAWNLFFLLFYIMFSFQVPCNQIPNLIQILLFLVFEFLSYLILKQVITL